MTYRLHPRILASFLLMCTWSGVIAAYPREGAPSTSDAAATLVPIQANDGVAGDTFGKSVAIDGDLMAVGASAADVRSVNSPGVVYLFARDTSTTSGWTQLKKIESPEPEVSQLFGVTVALDGDVLAVGATATNVDGGSDNGAVYVFERDQGGTDAWGLRTRLTESVTAFSEYGGALSLQGDMMLVGARGASGQRGAAFLYERTDEWAMVKDFHDEGGVIADYFGEAVALDGDTVIVGQPMSAFNNRDDNAGAVFVFERNESGPDEWGEVQRLIAPMPEDGSRFGAKLALQGDTLVVGAPEADGTILPAIADTGAAFIFGRDPSTRNWGFRTRLALGDGATGARYGSALALAGDDLWVGAPLHRDGSRFPKGKVYSYGRDVGGADGWGATEPLTPDALALGELFGSALATDATTLAIGAPNRDDGRGAVYVPGTNEPEPPATTQVFLPVVSAIRFVPTGVLLDGGIVEAASGARVGAVAGTLRHDVGILIETAPSSPVALGDNVMAVGSFHVIAATERVATPADKPILIGLPVPDGANVDDMALAMLQPIESTTGARDYKWTAVPGRFDAESGLFVSTIGALTSDLVSIVLIEHPSLDPIQVATGASASDRIDGSTPAQTSGRFVVLCDPFSTRFTCPSGNRDLLATQLELAYGEFVLNFRFREPNLPRANGVFRGPNGVPILTPTFAFHGVFVATDPCVDNKGEAFAGLYSWADRTLQVCMARGTTGEDIRPTVRHELFHAIQASYSAMYQDALPGPRAFADWTIEGTAAAAERSSVSMVVSEDYPAHTISDRLSDNADLLEYHAQDFWVYTGREERESLDYLRVVFEAGATPEHVATALDLNESYWKWAKNQAFEKTIRIHPDMQEPVCTIERTLTGEHEEASWTGTGTTRVSGSLTQLTSKVVEINFTRTMEAGVVTLTSSGGDDVRYKVFFSNGADDCADDPDGERNLSVLRGNTIYVLVSNTDGEGSNSYTLTVTGVQ